MFIFKACMLVLFSSPSSSVSSWSASGTREYAGSDQGQVSQKFFCIYKMVWKVCNCRNHN